MSLRTNKGNEVTIGLQNFDGYTAACEADFRVRGTLEHAESHLRDDLSLQRLAATANVSEWHICRLFRRDLGISPARCIKLLRLTHAANLLAATPLSVKQVMAAVGLNDESHFVRDFRKLFGKSPVRYRAHT